MEVNEQTLKSATRPGAKTDTGRVLRRKRALSAWLFMLPLIVVNMLVILGPSIATVYYSFTEWSGIGPAEWVGLQNYADILGDEDFWSALGHNLLWTVIFLTVPIAMGLGGAFLLSQITRFQMVFRILYFIPYVMASVVNAACGACLASSAIRCRRVEMGSGLGVPGIFPSSGLMARRPLPSAGSLGSVPPRHR